MTKTNFNAKVTEIEGKIPDVTNLIAKTDFDAELKKVSDRVTSNKAKDLLLENEIKRTGKI